MNKRVLWLLVAVNLIAAPAIFFTVNRMVNKKMVVYANPGAGSLADYGLITDFALTEKSGTGVTLDHLKGSPWIANFMFTSCQGLCPMMNLKMSGLQNSLPAAMKLVSFTVDPGKDTPEVLLDYSKKYGAQDGRWLFLTGSKETIDAVLTSVHFNKADNPDLHSARFVLVDSQFHIRGYYNSMDENDLKKIVEDAALLIGKEKGGRA